MKKIFLIIFISLFILSCNSSMPTEKSCSTDTDCVPAECCHARETVNKEYAPRCEGMLCTMNCEPETLDCGQGEIKCVDGECQVFILPIQ